MALRLVTRLFSVVSPGLPVSETGTRVLEESPVDVSVRLTTKLPFFGGK